MARYAVLDIEVVSVTPASPGIVQTVARWDGLKPWVLSARAVLAPADVQPGYVYDGTSFSFTPVLAPLGERKARLTQFIDEQTESDIHNGPGFEWPPASGQFFSLSSNAQTKWLGMRVASAQFDYVLDPPKVRTKDDLVEYTLTSAVEVEMATAVALNTVRMALTAGREAKGLVLACTTHEELDALRVANGWPDL